MLESRENPALYWDPIAGGDQSATISNNWVTSIGGSTTTRLSSSINPLSPLEELVFGAYIPLSYNYTQGGPIPIAAHWSTAGAVLTQPSQYTTNGVANYNGLTLLSTFPSSSEVELRQSALVHAVSVFGGAIKQNDQATVGGGDAGTLTIDQTLDWTAGTINSNTVPGQLNLTAHASGEIHPAEGTTVNLGDTLTLLGDGTQYGATLTHSSGIWNLTQGTGIEVQGWTKLRHISAEVDTTSPPSPQPAQQHRTDASSVVTAGGKLTIKTNGEVGYYPKNNTYDQTKRYEYTEGLAVENAGTLIVKQNTNLKVTGTQPFQPTVGNIVDWGVYQTGGQTQFEAASAITTPAVRYEGGQLQVTVLPGSTQANRPAAYMVSNMYFSGTASLYMTGSIFGVLAVSGSLYWSGGEFRLALGMDGNTPIADQVVVQQNVEITNTPKISLRWTGQVPTSPKNTSWDVITTLTGTITGGVTLDYEYPLENMTFSWSIDGLTQKKLRIIKTN